jgi:anaerobic magnesium-protoporphyrin IX monomethyl ester cyclase
VSSKPVCLIAFEEQDNLGVGYLASVILQAGFSARIIDFRLDKQQILEKLRSYDPLMVGFSIIFQYHIDDFKNLIDYLRRHEIYCHFSAGGHYPSLNYEELLRYVPQLDSVVLFEGEHTFLELVKAIHSGRDWRKIDGIAYRENGSSIVNPLRPLEKDLDVFPLPVRQPLKEFALGKKYATILAGRGCLYHCSFCSIREFYSKPSGLVKRVRRPRLVVREMELLQKHKDCSVFMFQDDDFPVAQDKGHWIAEFCKLLVNKGLSKKIMWKINCRPDEVEFDKFELMKDCGLFLVYLGIESGTNEGLLLMNKRIKVETNIEAVEILKRLGINYDYGFMLFDPSTTYQSILDNLSFLETICGDGSSPITFCKMLPYAGTKIELELRNAGRLKGSIGFYDYDFLDPSLNHFYFFMVECFGDWIMRRDGLLNASRWARYYLAAYEKYFARDHIFEDLDRTLRKIVSQSNQFFVSTTRTLVSMFGSQEYEREKGILDIIKDDVAKKESEYCQELEKVFDRFPRANIEETLRNLS